MDPEKTSSTHPGTTSMPTNPIQAVVAEVAGAAKRRDDELAHRMAMDVLGLADDPLKAAIEKVIPERVDRQGNRRPNN